MKRILIVESDAHFASRLREAILARQAAVVSTAVTLREACIQLAGAAHDVALIALRLEKEGLGQSLRTIQPDLRLIIMPPDVDFELPASRRGLYQGILVKSLLDADLAAVLTNAFRFPFKPDFATENGIAARARLAGHASAEIVTILRQANPDDRLLAILLAEEDQLLAQCGVLNRRQATAVTLLTNALPPTGSQLEFMRLPGESGDTLLYSRRLGPVRLTLVAAGDESPGRLRQLTDSLATRLSPFWPDETSGSTIEEALALETPVDLPESFVLFWRPVKRLPPSLRLPLHRAVKRLAGEADMRLHHLEVAPDHVHAVVTCPPGRRAAWAIQRFKSGTENAVQQQFKIQVQLWRRGHYAAPSTLPLTEREIALFLAA